MNRDNIYAIVLQAISKSDVAFVNKFEDAESRELAHEVTDNIVTQLKAHGESAEGVFNMDAEEQSTVVIIDELLKNE